jgi:hypothetical protein
VSQETCRLWVREETSRSRGIDCTDAAICFGDPFALFEREKDLAFPVLLLKTGVLHTNKGSSFTMSSKKEEKS